MAVEGSLAAVDMSSPLENVELDYIMVKKAPSQLHKPENVLNIGVPTKGSWFSDCCVIEGGDIVAIDGLKKKLIRLNQLGHVTNPDLGKSAGYAKLSNPWLVTSMQDQRVAVYNKDDNMVIVFPVEGGGPVRSFSIPEGTDSVSCNAYGHLITTHHDSKSKYIAIRNSDNGYVIRNILVVTQDGPVYGNTLRAVAGFSADNLIVTDSMHEWVRGYTMTGEIIFHLGKEGSTFRGVQFNSPLGLHADADGQVYVADHGSSSIIQVDLQQGTASKIIKVCNPLKIAMDGVGTLLVMTKTELQLYTKLSY